MNVIQLRDTLATPHPPLLLCVLPEDAPGLERIPGSRHACVYEIAFIDRVRELAPDPATPLIVYGSGLGPLETQVAVQRLQAAGYTQVTEFPGGIHAWRAAGEALEPVTPAATPDSATFAVHPTDSVIRWTGRNLTNHHHGTLRLAGGEIVIAHGVLQHASFAIDMNSITCEDIPDPQLNALLVQHLRSPDFFDTQEHPLATFATVSAEAIEGTTEGSPNYLLRGNFTLRGITRPLAFPAVIASSEPGRLTGQAQFEFDRTQFGSVYGSGRFFRFLGKHLVNDHVHVHVKLHADRA
jgi:polyisoprenoid-binding protein YceI